MANKLDLAQLSLEDLKAEVAKSQGELSALRFEHGASGLANPNQLKALRRNVARMLTELRARELKTLVESGVELKRDKIQARRRVARKRK